MLSFWLVLSVSNSEAAHMSVYLCGLKGSTCDSWPNPAVPKADRLYCKLRLPEMDTFAPFQTSLLLILLCTNNATILWVTQIQFWSQFAFFSILSAFISQWPSPWIVSVELHLPLSASPKQLTLILIAKYLGHPKSHCLPTPIISNSD